MPITMFTLPWCCWLMMMMVRMVHYKISFFLEVFEILISPKIFDFLWIKCIIMYLSFIKSFVFCDLDILMQPTNSSRKCFIININIVLKEYFVFCKPNNTIVWKTHIWFWIFIQLFLTKRLVLNYNTMKIVTFVLKHIEVVFDGHW